MNIFKEKREILNMWYTEPGSEKVKHLRLSAFISSSIYIIVDFEFNHLNFQWLVSRYEYGCWLDE